MTLDYFTKGYATRKLYDTPAYGVAFYHQSTIDDLLTRGLSLTFGIRYDYEHTSNDFLFYKETDGGSEQMDAFDSRSSPARSHRRSPCNICFPPPACSMPP